MILGLINLMINIYSDITNHVLILGAGGQIARHVINQLADKQTIKQTLFARQPAKIHKPYPTNKMQTTSGKKVIQDR